MRINHIPAQLSGGEQQRVSIARALINNPKIILADEPTGNLDSKMGEEISRYLRQLNQEKGITVLIVTHNSDIVSGADHVVQLKDGRLSY